jgi:hypothetical protein
MQKHETLSEKIKGLAQVEEHLPSNTKALNQISNI